MQRLGQHFLKNRAALNAIAEAVAPNANDVVIEVGPGHGELTDFLARAIGAKGRLILLERDTVLARALKEKYNGDSRIAIREGDALDLLPVIVGDLPRGEYRIAGNIPYYITGKLLRVVSELERRPVKAVLMVQKEVAERMSAVPPAMNRLAASVQFWADAKIVMRVPKKDFTPPPDVDSAVIALTTKTSAPPIAASRYYRAVRAIFSQPRKTVFNNLRAAVAGEEGSGGTGSIVKKGEMGAKTRPQDLGVADIVQITERFF